MRTIEPSSGLGLQADPMVRRRTTHQPGEVGDDLTTAVNRILQMLGYGYGEAPVRTYDRVIAMLRLSKHPIDIFSELYPTFDKSPSHKD
jgi:hypothetical protein